MDEIRAINLYLTNLYEEGDYNIIFTELTKTNNNLCKEAKEKDRRQLTNFKRIFNNLSKFYQYRLSKAEKSQSAELHYHDKGLDNVKFILENYLNIKYNFKKIKYETACLSDTTKYQIDICMKIIESKDYDIDVKNIYSSIKDCIIEYAKAEIIIANLPKIIKLCDEEAYFNIKTQVIKMIDKYQKIYKLNKEKYNIIVEQLNSKFDIDNDKQNTRIVKK